MATNVRTMIPKTITATHVRQAAAEIKARGVPKGREADRFLVMVDGEGFPPKYTLSIATKFATGNELGSGAFSGGNEANTFLENLGFKVISIGGNKSHAFLFLTNTEMNPGRVSTGPAQWGCSEVTKAGDRIFVGVSGIGMRYEWCAVSDSRPDFSSGFCCDVEFVRGIDPPIRTREFRDTIPVEVWTAPHGPFQGYGCHQIPDRAVPMVLALIQTDRTGGNPAWDQAIQRIKSAKSPNTYMPIAVIAALELIQEGQATAVAIPFDKFEERFDALQESLGEGAVGMGWEPFIHLAATAGIWTLLKDSKEIPYHRESRPRSRAQLAKVADHASLVEELRAGVNDSALIPKLKALIGATSQKPTADPTILAAAAEALKGKQGSEPPPGNKHPKQTEGTSKSYVRDPAVVRWVLDRAKGVCELCTKAAPFSNAQGDPFLEVHHCIHLADGGPDTPENARGLCPNCHREVHLGVNKLELRQRLTDL